MPSDYHKTDVWDAWQQVENGVGAAFKSFYLFFQPCNLVVFKLFYKDLWDQWKVVLSPEHLSAHCALAGWVLGRHFSKCYLIWQQDRIDLDYTNFFHPPVAVWKWCISECCSRAYFKTLTACIGFKQDSRERQFRICLVLWLEFMNWGNGWRNLSDHFLCVCFRVDSALFCLK